MGHALRSLRLAGPFGSAQGRLAGRPSPHRHIGADVMTSKPKGMGLGIALGAALGAVAGVLAGHVAIWLGIGIAIGMAIGTSFRSREGQCPECAAVHRTHELRVKS